MAKILLNEGVDILLLEMLLDIDHSKILLNAARNWFACMGWLKLLHK